MTRDEAVGMVAGFLHQHTKGNPDYWHCAAHGEGQTCCVDMLAEALSVLVQSADFGERDG